MQIHSVSDPLAPGQLQSHYAPSKKIIIGSIPELLQENPAHCTGILSFQDDYHSPYQFILSHSGDVNEAAQNLFTALRILDSMPIKVILSEQVPDHGLGRAINDRLKRAAATI